jgi:lipid-binding SYLF domain-containing protein
MRCINFILVLGLAVMPLAAADEKSTVEERLNESAELFSEIMSSADKSIPQDLLNRSHCIVLVPSLKKAAFLIGGKYGRGFALCRAQSGEGWGPPAAIRIEGGSFGLQIGVSATDVVLLVMNERGMKRLTTSKFTVGGEANAAAGPVGRDASAQTDAFMRAEILSWSRSRGVFAGISLTGATLRNDLDENKSMYGQPWTNKEILTSGVKPTAAAAKLISALNKYSPRKTT